MLADALVTRANIEIALGNLDQASTTLDEALAADSTNVAARIARARILARRGELARIGGWRAVRREVSEDLKLGISRFQVLNLALFPISAISVEEHLLLDQRQFGNVALQRLDHGEQLILLAAQPLERLVRHCDLDVGLNR
jgi:alkyl sulfatase BDS1-like metallo-beta-lactamase superfamily hydrolase